MRQSKLCGAVDLPWMCQLISFSCQISRSQYKILQFVTFPTKRYQRTRFPFYFSSCFCHNEENGAVPMATGALDWLHRAINCFSWFCVGSFWKVSSSTRLQESTLTTTKPGTKVYICSIIYKVSVLSTKILFSAQNKNSYSRQFTSANKKLIKIDKPKTWATRRFLNAEFNKVNSSMFFSSCFCQRWNMFLRRMWFGYIHLD
jgi:hypothetical protein